MLLLILLFTLLVAQWFLALKLFFGSGPRSLLFSENMSTNFKTCNDFVLFVQQLGGDFYFSGNSRLFATVCDGVLKKDRKTSSKVFEYLKKVREPL